MMLFHFCLIFKSVYPWPIRCALSTSASSTSIPASSDIIFTSPNIELALLLFFTEIPSIQRQSLLRHCSTSPRFCSKLKFKRFNYITWFWSICYSASSLSIFSFCFLINSSLRIFSQFLKTELHISFVLSKIDVFELHISPILICIAKKYNKKNTLTKNIL